MRNNRNGVGRAGLGSGGTKRVVFALPEREFDLSSGITDMIGPGNARLILELSLEKAIEDGDTDLLKKLLDRIMGEGSKVGSAASRDMEERMKRAMAQLEAMSEGEVKRLVGDYHSAFSAHLLPVALKESGET